VHSHLQHLDKGILAHGRLLSERPELLAGTGQLLHDVSVRKIVLIRIHSLCHRLLSTLGQCGDRLCLLRILGEHASLCCAPFRVGLVPAAVRQYFTVDWMLQTAWQTPKALRDASSTCWQGFEANCNRVTGWVAAAPDSAPRFCEASSLGEGVLCCCAKCICMQARTILNACMFRNSMREHRTPFATALLASSTALHAQQSGHHICLIPAVRVGKFGWFDQP